MRIIPPHQLAAALVAFFASVVAGVVFAWEEPRAETPPAPIVVRIYYDQISDLDQLTAYDLFEINNLDERYVLAAVSEYDLRNLQSQGWTLVRHDLPSTHSTIPASFYEDYRTVGELYEEMARLATLHPGLTELVTYGQSYCKIQGGCTTPGGEQTPGYDLRAMRVTNEAVPGASYLAVDGGAAVQRGQKPVFFLLANIHARELTTPEIAMRWLALLLEQYGSDPDITWLVDHHEMWVIPTANPDGHWVTELGADPQYGGFPLMQRKNLDQDADGDGTADCTVWPSKTYSQPGVDLNRNHSFGWQSAANLDSACNLTYSGPSAASEPETNALQNLVRMLFADSRGPGLDDSAAADTSGILITLHNYSELVLRPWAFSNTVSPDEHGLQLIGDKLAAFNGYLSCRPAQCLYSAHGTTDDWAYGELGIPAFTFEIGSPGDGFSPPYTVIDARQWPENRDAFLYAALIAREPYRLIEGPDVVKLAALPDNSGKSILLLAEFNDGEHGPQAVSRAEFSIDTPFWDSTSDPEEMMPAAGSNSDSAAYQAQIDLTGLEPGWHLVFVHAEDDAGNTGITRAVYLKVASTQPAPVYVPLIVGS